mmetsp:Transcript_22162/g.87920  ORF Transcript_22162/g.87920 Transcript_22162/m.87920 type:complete len:253 (+) Transcript_22162:936-1694(+)
MARSYVRDVSSRNRCRCGLGATAWDDDWSKSTSVWSRSSTRSGAPGRRGAIQSIVVLATNASRSARLRRLARHRAANARARDAPEEDTAARASPVTTTSTSSSSSSSSRPSERSSMTSAPSAVSAGSRASLAPMTVNRKKYAEHRSRFFLSASGHCFDDAAAPSSDASRRRNRSPRRASSEGSLPLTRPTSFWRFAGICVSDSSSALRSPTARSPERPGSVISRPSNRGRKNRSASSSVASSSTSFAGPSAS